LKKKKEKKLHIIFPRIIIMNKNKKSENYFEFKPKNQINKANKLKIEVLPNSNPN